MLGILKIGKNLDDINRRLAMIERWLATHDGRLSSIDMTTLECGVSLDRLESAVNNATRVLKDLEAMRNPVL